MRSSSAILFALYVVASAAASPCCRSCSGSTVKYWALDTPNNECAVTCLNPSDKLKIAEFGILTGFKGKQAGNETDPCTDAHFSTYNRTDTIGAGPIKILLDKYLPDGDHAVFSPRMAPFVVADMHDGDQKSITFEVDKQKGNVIPMVIRPHANNETWEVEVMMHLTEAKVSGLVDFNVAGKPNPPPCNLTVALWTESAGANGKGQSKYTMEFTDPTGTINNDTTFPLNTWVELPSK